MVQLAEVSWKDAEKALETIDVLLLPVGSTEQHGPHNPMGTDHLVAAAVTKVVGDKTGVLVSPVVPVGVSINHIQFSGSLTVSPSILRDYVVEVALSAAEHGVTKVVIMNGHGGNTAALMESAAILRRNYGIFACVLLAMPPGPDGHAGAMETSLNLYFHPELVDMSKAVDTLQKSKLGPFEITGMNRIGHAVFPYDTIDLSDSGVMGKAGTVVKATEGSFEKGRDALEPFMDEICEFVEVLKKADVGELLPKPHTRK